MELLKSKRKNIDKLLTKRFGTKIVAEIAKCGAKRLRKISLECLRPEGRDLKLADRMTLLQGCTYDQLKVIKCKHEGKRKRKETCGMLRLIKSWKQVPEY